MHCNPSAKAQALYAYPYYLILFYEADVVKKKYVGVVQELRRIAIPKPIYELMKLKKGDYVEVEIRKAR